MDRNVVFLVSMAGLMTAAVPAPATACSWLAEAIKSSLPASGASDVPIDVAPIIRGHGDPTLLRWETQAGEPVEFDVRVGQSASFTEGTTAELVPRAQLRPNTAYVVHARLTPDYGSEEERLEFTTGVATADAGLSAAPSLAATVLNTEPGMCTSDNTASCIFGGHTQLLLEVLDADGKELVRDVVAGDVLTYVTDPHCIRVSTRSASGRVSAATELCGAELKIGRARNELDGTHPCRGGGFSPAGPAAGKPVPSTLEASQTVPDAGTAASSASAADLSAATAADANGEHEESGCTLASGRNVTGGTSALSLLLAASVLASGRKRRASRTEPLAG